MSKKEALQTFGNRNVRVVWDDGAEKWYFSVVDVCGALTDSNYQTARKYWKVLKGRLIKEGNESVTNCYQLKMVSPIDGKRYNTDVATSEQLFLIIQSIPSSKIEQFKQWLEQFSPKSQAGSFEQLPDIESAQGEIVLYQPDETIRMEVRLENDTVWLTQAQIVELFQSSKANISEHITNIYEQGELVYEATVRNFRTVQKEGNRQVNRVLTFYNLDAINPVRTDLQSGRPEYKDLQSACCIANAYTRCERIANPLEQVLY